MKRAILIIILILNKLLLSGQVEPARVFQLLNAGTYDEINTYLANLDSLAQKSQVNAYKGTLLMRKANFEKTPREKLELFKTGRILLENEISSHPDNLEYRLLRFIIQENAPPVLKYNQQLNHDKTKIIEGYKSADSFLQDQIKTYCNYSIILKLSDLEL